jgi:hypothetical protein
MRWAAMRLGQLTTQWSAAPQLKQFFFPDAFAIDVKGYLNKLPSCYI